MAEIADAYRCCDIGGVATPQLPTGDPAGEWTIPFLPAHTLLTRTTTTLAIDPHGHSLELFNKPRVTTIKYYSLISVLHFIPVDHLFDAENYRPLNYPE
jgi:hypothetical protein